MVKRRRRRRRRRPQQPRILRIHGRSFKREDLPSGTESRESHAEFIALNWELGAALAWKGYREEGRGAVVVFSDKAKSEWERMPWGTLWDFSVTPAAWISDQAMQEARQSWPPDEARMIREYDPNIEVVTIILRDDGGVSSYRMFMPGHPSPPEAYELMQEELKRRRMEP